MLRTKYIGVDRTFHSPFGIIGAVYAFCVFFLGFISTIGYQPDRYVAAKVFSALCAAITVYYYGYARSRQKLSKDEQKSVFKLHVINFNLRMQDSVLHKKRPAHRRGLQFSDFSLIYNFFTVDLKFYFKYFCCCFCCKVFPSDKLDLKAELDRFGASRVTARTEKSPTNFINNESKASSYY